MDAKESPTATNRAVLCTHDRTFHIRQVHSSNSIFLLQPSQTSLADEDGSIPLDRVSAIAQPTATLELIPSSFRGPSMLRNVLPVYNISRIESEGNPGSALVSRLADKMSKYATLDNVPLSSTEFEAFWTQLCAFEFEGQSWLPAATLLVGVWKSIISAAIANSLNLEQSFRIQDIMDLLREDGYPVPLIEAVVRRIRSGGHDLMDGCKSILTQL